MLRVFRTYSTKLIQNKVQPSKCFIDKILIANRGEIACRIIRTARKLGVRTVAVYSEVDEKSLHTESADEAYFIGPAPSQESYLRGDKIIEIAKKSNCKAIHPGYGFLSESVEFAEFCEREGITFIGPPSDAIKNMGIKNTSKEIMIAAGVPVINGYHGKDQSDENLLKKANEIGFPLMIKAVRGGGGKGMRIAEKEEDFLNALYSARTESEKAFKDSSVLLERFVKSPRHVEVQIFADKFGNCVYLFERDCSVQRRHQKIIEEAPAPGITDELRQKLGEAAVKAAKAVGYVGAGTVEFILDKEDNSFYFMEMNTRLQVEHPITEMITNTDLVEWQLLVASGELLPLSQEQIKRKGHAFEARIYAENPNDNFLPGAGPLNHLTAPSSNQQYVRVETGVRQGDEVSVHYDPMIAKLVVWGKNRSQALNSLVEQLRNYHITGLETNVDFLINLALHPEFYAGNVHTGFIQEHYQGLFPFKKISDCTLCEAAVAIALNDFYALQINSNLNILNKVDPFIMAVGLRPNHENKREIKLKFNDQEHNIKVKQLDNKNFEVQLKNGNCKNVKAISIPHRKRFNLKCNIDGAISNVSVVIDNKSVTLFGANGKTKLDFVQPKFLTENTETVVINTSSVVAPMPGVLEKLLVKSGDHVKKGDSLAVLIAMKMEYVLKAPKDAIVKAIESKPGDSIYKDAVIILFEEESEWDLRED